MKNIKESKNTKPNAMDIIDRAINEEWPNWNDYSMKNYFTKVATLIPNQEKETLVVQKDFDKRYVTTKGACYAMVIDGKFVRQGKTDTTLKERIQSYNCGKQQYRDKGTCSVSNYKCLQSILAINKPVELYAYFVPPISFTAFGEDVVTNMSPAKYIEKVLNTQIEKEFNGKLPWCIQK